MLSFLWWPLAAIAAMREGPLAVLKALGRALLWFFFPVGGPPNWKRLAYALAVIVLLVLALSLRSCGAQGVNSWDAAPYDFYRP